MGMTTKPPDPLRWRSIGPWRIECEATEVKSFRGGELMVGMMSVVTDMKEEFYL